MLGSPCWCTVAALLGARAFAQELQFPSTHNAADGVYTLRLGQKGLTTSGAYDITSRGYTNGVTFRMKPGETLKVLLVNELLASNNVACTVTAGEYCQATTTNFHTHGLHVSSKAAGEDGFTYDSDNVFADVAPGGTQKQFEFAIPDYHMGGTHWYHPHHHHATALQAGGGAAGTLIVEDPDGYLPSEYASMTEKVLFIAGLNLQTLQTIATSSQSSLLTDAVAKANAAGLDTNVFLVNGQMGPTMTINSHGWYRLRMVYAAVEQTLKLAVAGDPVCTMNLIAKDGVYLPTIPRTITTIHLYPGARADVAISCTCATYPCSGTLTSTARRLRRLQGGGGRPGGGGAGPGAAGMAAVNVDVITLTIQETAGGTVVTLPTTTLDRPCYLANLQQAAVPDSNRGTLALNGGQRTVTWNGNGQSMTYANVHAGGGTKETWPAITSFTVGSVYEMDVTGANAHPLHLHVNPFQIAEMGGDTSLEGGYFQVGDWHDTLYVEALNGALKVRMNTDVFTGRMVVHCHILEHEDEGMMSFIQLTGTEGATFANAATLQPGCYTSAWSSTGSSGSDSGASTDGAAADAATTPRATAASGSTSSNQLWHVVHLAPALSAAGWLLG